MNECKYAKFTDCMCIQRTSVWCVLECVFTISSLFPVVQVSVEQFKPPVTPRLGDKTVWPYCWTRSVAKDTSPVCTRADTTRLVTMTAVTMRMLGSSVNLTVRGVGS